MQENKKTNSIFTEETKKVKRNSLTLSTLSLFFGLTQTIPNEFVLIGIKLNDINQITLLAWFIFVITLYFFLYFLSCALPEIIKWHRHVKYEELSTSAERYHSEPHEYHEQKRIKGNALEEELYDVKKKVKNMWKKLYKYMKWIKLFLEVAPALIIGFVSLIMFGRYILVVL